MPVTLKMHSYCECKEFPNEQGEYVMPDSVCPVHGSKELRQALKNAFSEAHELFKQRIKEHVK